MFKLENDPMSQALEMAHVAHEMERAFNAPAKHRNAFFDIAQRFDAFESQLESLRGAK